MRRCEIRLIRMTESQIQMYSRDPFLVKKSESITEPTTNEPIPEPSQLSHVLGSVSVSDHVIESAKNGDEECLSEEKSLKEEHNVEKLPNQQPKPERLSDSLPDLEQYVKSPENTLPDLQYKTVSLPDSNVRVTTSVGNYPREHNFENTSNLLKRRQRKRILGIDVVQDHCSTDDISSVPSKRKTKKMADMKEFLEREKNVSLLNDICRYAALQKYRPKNSKTNSRSALIDSGSDYNCQYVRKINKNNKGMDKFSPTQESIEINYYMPDVWDLSVKSHPTKIPNPTITPGTSISVKDQSTSVKKPTTACSNDVEDIGKTISIDIKRNDHVCNIFDSSEGSRFVPESNKDSFIKIPNYTEPINDLNIENCVEDATPCHLKISDVKGEVNMYSDDSNSGESILVIDEGFESSPRDIDESNPDQVVCEKKQADENSKKPDDTRNIIINSYESPAVIREIKEQCVRFEVNTKNNLDDTTSINENGIIEHNTAGGMEIEQPLINNDSKTIKYINATENKNKIEAIVLQENSKCENNTGTTNNEDKNKENNAKINKVYDIEIDTPSIYQSFDFSNLGTGKKVKKQFVRVESCFTDWTFSQNEPHSRVEGTEKGVECENGMLSEAKSEICESTPNKDNHNVKLKEHEVSQHSIDPIISIDSDSSSSQEFFLDNADIKSDVLRKLLERGLSIQKDTLAYPAENTTNLETKNTNQEMNSSSSVFARVSAVHDLQDKQRTSINHKELDYFGEFNRVIYLMYRELLSPISQHLISQMTDILYLVVTESLRYSDRNRKAKHLLSVELLIREESLARRDFHAKTAAHGTYFTYLFKTVENSFPASKAFHTFMYLALYVHIFKKLKTTYHVHSSYIHILRKLMVTMLKSNAYENILMYSAICKADTDFETDFLLVSQLIDTFDTYAKSSDEADCFAYQATYFVHPPPENNPSQEFQAHEINSLTPLKLVPNLNTHHSQHYEHLRSKNQRMKCPTLPSWSKNPIPRVNEVLDKKEFIPSTAHVNTTKKMNIYPKKMEYHNNSDKFRKPVPCHMYQDSTYRKQNPFHYKSINEVSSSTSFSETTDRKYHSNAQGPADRISEANTSQHNNVIWKPTAIHPGMKDFEIPQPQYKNRDPRSYASCARLKSSSTHTASKTPKDTTLRRPIPILPRSRSSGVPDQFPSNTSSPGYVFNINGPPNVYMMPNTRFEYHPYYPHLFSYSRATPLPKDSQELRMFSRNIQDSVTPPTLNPVLHKESQCITPLPFGYVPHIISDAVHSLVELPMAPYLHYSRDGRLQGCSSTFPNILSRHSSSGK